MTSAHVHTSKILPVTSDWVSPLPGTGRSRAYRWLLVQDWRRIQLDWERRRGRRPSTVARPNTDLSSSSSFHVAAAEHSNRAWTWSPAADGLFTADERNWTDLQQVDPVTRSSRRVHWSRASASRLDWLSETRSVLSQFVRCEHSHCKTRVQNWSSV